MKQKPYAISSRHDSEWLESRLALCRTTNSLFRRSMKIAVNSLYSLLYSFGMVLWSTKCLFKSVTQVASVRPQYLISPHQMRVVVTAEWDRFERAGGTSDQRGRSEITTHLEIYIFFVFYLVSRALSRPHSLSLFYFRSGSVLFVKGILSNRKPPGPWSGVVDTRRALKTAYLLHPNENAEASGLQGPTLGSVVVVVVFYFR